MSQVQLTFTFANAAMAAAFLASLPAAVAGNATSAAPTADTARTAVAALAAAPAPSATPVPSQPAPLDFDRDVLPAVQALHGSNGPKFAALMQHYGFADVNALRAASDKWVEIVGHCKA